MSHFKINGCKISQNEIDCEIELPPYIRENEYTYKIKNTKNKNSYSLKNLFHENDVFAPQYDDITKTIIISKSQISKKRLIEITQKFF